MEDSRSHYAARLRLAGEERFFVWYSDTNDVVLLSSPKTIALFPSRPEVDQYAATQNISLEAGNRRSTTLTD